MSFLDQRDLWQIADKLWFVSVGNETTPSTAKPNQVFLCCAHEKLFKIILFHLPLYLDSFPPVFPQNTSKDASLNSATECYSKGKQDFLASICKDQQKLLNHQKSLKEKFDRDFVGKSVHDTIHMLLTMHEIKLAEKLRAEYKVSDYCY